MRLPADPAAARLATNTTRQGKEMEEETPGEARERRESRRGKLRNREGDCRHVDAAVGGGGGVER